MNKANEIALLQELFIDEDTYFHDQVSDSDFNQMIDNIRNDHPLFLNTTWSIASNYWNEKTRIDNQIAKLPVNITIHKMNVFPSDLPNGTPTLRFWLHDVYEEGRLGGELRVNSAGTGYEIRTFSQPMRLESICDQYQGLQRLYGWLSNHVDDIITILGAKLTTLQHGEEEIIKI